jgi:hypothetical protein
LKSASTGLCVSVAVRIRVIPAAAEKLACRLLYERQSVLAVVRSEANDCLPAPCQRRKPPKAVAEGQRLQGAGRQSPSMIEGDDRRQSPPPRQRACRPRQRETMFGPRKAPYRNELPAVCARIHAAADRLWVMAARAAVVVVEPFVFRPGGAFSAPVRRLVASKSFDRIYDTAALFQTISNLHPIGRALPRGRQKIVNPTEVVLIDRNGNARKCIAEAFNSTHQIFVLLYDRRGLNMI